MSAVFSCFTDGSALNNSSRSNAGWAYYIPELKLVESGYIIGTNNFAELMAMKKLFEKLVEVQPTKPVLIFTDSKYVIGIMTGNKAKVNQELIAGIKALKLLIKCKILIRHCSAHTGKKDFVGIGNDIVDKAARERAKNKQ